MYIVKDNDVDSQKISKIYLLSCLRRNCYVERVLNPNEKGALIKNG